MEQGENEKRYVTLSNGLLEFFINNTGSPMPKLLNDSRIPGKTQYWLAKIVSIMRRELADYFSIKKIIIEKYALKNDKGEFVVDAMGQYTIPPENALAYAAELKPVLEEEIELVGIRKIIIDLNTFPEGIFTAADMLALEGICDFVGTDL